MTRRAARSWWTIRPGYTDSDMRFLIPLVLTAACFAQSAGEPLRYTCRRAAHPIQVDGKLDDRAWRDAPWTSWFVDIQGSSQPAPRFRTRVKMLWDDDYFYVGAELEEPHLRASLTEHDSVIFHDNDFEVFLNPSGDSHNYFEFEINALNTSWDLFLPKPYRMGGKADNSWDIPGLQSAVSLNGTLNHPGDRDRSWTVEMAFPWAAFASRAKVERPRVGDTWRINFSRVEWRSTVVQGKYQNVPGAREDNWVWSPQGLINMHVPEHWGYVHFEKRP